MTRARVFKTPDSKKTPAIRIEFKGKNLMNYFSLNKVAVEDFETNQTDLCRRILVDWLSLYRNEKKAGNDTACRKMLLRLGAPAAVVEKSKGEKA